MAMPLYVVLVVTLLWSAASWSIAGDAVGGIYSGDNLRVELKSDDGRNFTGVASTGELSMPLAARLEGAALVGTFESGGTKFNFRAQARDDGLEFVTDGTRYNLKREKPRNPLVAGGGTPGAPLPPPQPGNPAPAPVDPKSPRSKDPLAYRILQLPGGTVAKFDNWTYGPLQGDANVLWCDAFPEGRQQDFVMRAYVGTPNARDMANLFDVGPKYAQGLLQQLFGPVFQRSGDPKKTTCGGDEAMVENYTGSVAGKNLACQVMYVKRKDVAVAVMCVGNEQGFKEFGRAIEIVSQSITLKESAIEQSLIGTWVLESFSSAGSGSGSDTKINVASSRSITIFPNGTFSDTAQTGFSGQDVGGLAKGGSRGTVVKRGNVLSFKYDNGESWSAAYELYSNGLKLDGKVYLKQ